MEKLKQIIWERIGHASVCWDEKGVFDEVEANKAANAIWDAVQPLLQADSIVRRLATTHETHLSVLIHEAKIYCDKSKTNLNDRGEELESAFILHRSLEWKLNAANKRIDELKKYADHLEGCKLRYRSKAKDNACTCGLEEVLK